jgi:hypothetical protein
MCRHALSSHIRAAECEVTCHRCDDRNDGKDDERTRHGYTSRMRIETAPDSLV